MPATISSPKSASQSSRILCFAVFEIISLVIWWRPILSSFALALNDQQYTHLLLILPVTISLILLQWQPPERDQPSIQATAIAVSVLLASALLITAGTRLQIFPLPADEQLTLNMLSLVAWWVGAFLLSFGFQAARRALLPLLFLLWMVPLPEILLNPIVRLLQEGSVASCRLLFSIAGVPVAQQGTQLTIPGLTVEVARECSSIRSSLMLLFTTMVLAQVTLHSAWRKVAIIAIAAPLSVAKNGLRIFVLAMLTTRVDRTFITGRLHHQGGIIYFALALATILLLIWTAHWTESRSKIIPLKPSKMADVSPLH